MKQPILIDMAGVSAIDARFFGLLLMLRRQVIKCGGTFSFTRVPDRIARAFLFNGVQFLLIAENGTHL